MKTATSLVQSALSVFNLRLVRRNRFDRLCGVLDARVAEAGWLVRDIPAWYEPVVAEPGVNLALRDLIRPGDTCFDVGAFDGALTQVMSRATGPRGLVCSFEANPGQLAKLTNNCHANALSNVHLVHAAVWHRTGEWVTMIVPPAAPAAAEITGTVDPDTAEIAIPTLALDDYANRHGLIPNVVKMDIEGAEYHALRGFQNILSRCKPHLLLEQRTHEIPAIDFARDLGYEAFDASSYEDIHTPGDFPAGSSVRNVVCIHRDRLRETAYANRRSRRLLKEIAGDELTRPDAATYEAELRLPPGRYIAEVELAADANDTLSFEIAHDRAIRGKCYVVAWWFLANGWDIPFHLHRETTVTARLQKIDGTGRMRLDRLKLHAVDGVTPVAGLGNVL